MIQVGYRDNDGKIHISREGFDFWCGYQGHAETVMFSEPVFPDVEDHRCPFCLMEKEAFEAA